MLCASNIQPRNVEQKRSARPPSHGTFGRLRLLATIKDRAVLEKILTHVGLPVDLPRPSAARSTSPPA
jgi:hypothetical protein